MNYTKLFQHLERQKIKRTELVKRGVVSASTMQRLRKGQAVSLYTLDRLSRYLDCSIFDLIETED